MELGSAIKWRAGVHIEPNVVTVRISALRESQTTLFYGTFAHII